MPHLQSANDLTMIATVLFTDIQYIDTIQIISQYLCSFLCVYLIQDILLRCSFPLFLQVDYFLHAVI